MSGGDAEQLLDFLSQSGRYDLIVVDLDSGMDEAAAAVWRQSSSILWLLEHAESSMVKNRMALEYAERTYPDEWRTARAGICFVGTGVGASGGYAGLESEVAAYLPWMKSYSQGAEVSPEYVRNARN